MGGNRRGLIWILLGLALLLGAAGLSLYNRWEASRAEDASVSLLPELVSQIPTLPPEQTDPPAPAATVPLSLLPLPQGEMPEANLAGYPYIGVLKVPSLELELPVISQWSYPRLKVAPCRYQGSAYTGDLILCGHNYPNHFGRLSSLCQGDVVTLTDLDGNVFSYSLVETEILDGGDVDGMEAGDWDLTLFTCTLGGQTRVTLRFRLTEFSKLPQED